ADSYKLQGTAYNWIRDAVAATSSPVAFSSAQNSSNPHFPGTDVGEPASTTTTMTSSATIATTNPGIIKANTTLSNQSDSKAREQKGALMRSLSPAKLLDVIANTLWQDFNGAIPIGRVNLLKVHDLTNTLRIALFSRLRNDFSTKIAAALRSGDHPSGFLPG